MMYRPLLESMRYVTRGPFGDIQFKALPENTKWSGVARSKGIATYLFNQRLTVRVGNQEIPIGGIINTQGKRKNKLAEFVLGSLRMRKYLQEQGIALPSDLDIDLKSFEPLDVTDLATIGKLSK